MIYKIEKLFIYMNESLLFIYHVFIIIKHLFIINSL